MSETMTISRSGEPSASPTESDRDAEGTATQQGITGQFATCKIGGMLLLKLLGFIEDERAEILEVAEDHVVLRLGQPWYRRWWNGSERRRPVSVRLDFAEPGDDQPRWKAATARRSMVNVDIRPMARSHRGRAFAQRADSVLRNLRLHFVAD